MLDTLSTSIFVILFRRFYLLRRGLSIDIIILYYFIDCFVFILFSTDAVFLSIRILFAVLRFVNFQLILTDLLDGT